MRAGEEATAVEVGSYGELRTKLIEFFHAEKEAIDTVSVHIVSEGSSMTNRWKYRGPIVERILDHVEMCPITKFRVCYTIEDIIGTHTCSPWILKPKHVPMTIWYHGTSAESAASIRKEGFREGTYFGQDLADAVEYGSGHIFEVALPSTMFSEAGWQMRIPDPVPPICIVSYYTVSIGEIYEDKALRQAVFKSNTKRGECEGKDAL